MFSHYAQGIAYVDNSGFAFTQLLTPRDSLNGWDTAVFDASNWDEL